ncbi:MAG: DUF5591 domain-containing protein [Candidatus Thermoplasmatota archaeon]
MIEITDRWGLAKKGIWEFKEQQIELPNIFFLEGGRFDPPSNAEITISTSKDSTFTIFESFFQSSDDSSFPTPFAYPNGVGDGLVKTRGGHEKIQVIYDQEPDPGAELYVLGNAPELLHRSDLLYEKLVGLRKKLEYHKLIYAPGIAQPQNMALLSYLGVDFFDSSFSEFIGLDDVELTDWMGFAGRPESNNINLLRELELVRKGIENGRIRELVESRVRTEPWLVEVLRAADEDYEVFSKGVPVTGKTLDATTRESLNRPDIKSFIRRIKNRYEPPERDVLLLLPCSARKPYFLSRTHSRIRDATQQGDWTELQEVVLTSPLGAVPRELEQFYPAQQYDIPVTDEWFEDEKELIMEQLKTIMDKRGYKKVISHLPEGMSFVADEIGCINTTEGAHPTSAEAIERLAEAVKRHVGEDLGSVSRYLKENLTSFAVFQFGERGKALLEGAEVKGRYPRYKIIEGGEQRGMLVPERGLISLTLEGAQKLKGQQIYQAQIDDFKPKGSVFAVGVKKADHEIRPEDEVLVLHKDELRGVGPASMLGKEMEDAERGEAVRLRHYP